jgi:hypothetical protein
MEPVITIAAPVVLPIIHKLSALLLHVHLSSRFEPFTANECTKNSRAISSVNAELKMNQPILLMETEQVSDTLVFN